MDLGLVVSLLRDKVAKFLSIFDDETGFKKFKDIVNAINTDENFIISQWNVEIFTEDMFKDVSEIYEIMILRAKALMLEVSSEESASLLKEH